MPAAVLQPHAKNVLADTTNSHRNRAPASPSAGTKRKHDGAPVALTRPPVKRLNGPQTGSSQPKSQFEEEVLEKLTQHINGLRKNNAERDQQWKRPSLDDFNPDHDSLCFQQVEAEEGTLRGGKTTVKLFGTTEVRSSSPRHTVASTDIVQTGHSVLLHVTDFLHYLYVAAPISFTKEDCPGFKSYLETQLAQHSPAIHSVQMVMRENLFKFQGNQKSPFLKITTTDPRHINKLRTTIEKGDANYKNLWQGADGGILTFDSIQYVLRFMIDCNVS